MSDLNMDVVHKKIGENVARFRKEASFSQLALSLELGHKSVSIVSSAEKNYNGKHFNINHIFEIANILKIDVCKLLEQDKD